MSNTDRLRELLEHTAPDTPDVSVGDRTAAVTRRGRAARRRDHALVAGAVMAVAVAVAVPVALQRGDGGGTDTATQPAVTAAPCPARPVDVAQPGPALDLGGVVAVRACPAVGEQGDPLPVRPLTGGAAEAFAADVAALPAYRMPDSCAVANVMPQPWGLQVETADGTTAVLGSTMRTCSSVSVGGSDRGVDGVVATFVGNLARQESGGPGALACPAGKRLADGAATWNASFDIAAATAGIVCYRVDPLGTREYAALDGTLDADQLATVRDDLSANLQPDPTDGFCTDTGPQRLLVLEDEDGDQAAFADDRCQSAFEGAAGSWRPSPAAEDAITDALGGRVSR